jgi:predicted transposase/invertase (TIGR01784 family)
MVTRSMISFDWAMKRLLRSKANFDVLEGFLSELLKRKIKIKNISESEGNKENKDDKYNHVDIFVEADGEELVIVELQFDSQSDYFHRMLYGTSKAISEHIYEGDAYKKVRKVYSINIVYFDLGTGDDYIYHGISHFKGLHTHNELQLNDEQKQIYKKTFVGDLYPEYYILKIKNFNDVARDTLDQWIYYLKTNKILDNFTAQGLDKARKVLAFDNMSDEEKHQYWYNVEARRIKESEIFTALYKGRYEGLAEGKAEGLAEGEAKGKAEGKIEEKLEIAQKLKTRGMPFEQISEITNLSIEEIEKL